MTRTKGRSCSNKTKYSSYEEAKDALRYLIAKGGAFAPRMQVYECRFCEFFHIGHKLRYKGQS